MTESTYFKLSKNIYPKHYDIELYPNLSDFTFSENVTIYIMIKETTKSIILHSKDLIIDHAAIRGCFEKNTSVVSSFDFDTENEIVTLNFGETKQFLPGDYVLFLACRGFINDNLDGFYRSKYKVNNEVRYMATTQFEPTCARKAFPCFDEPSFKATFDVTIIGPKDKTILSNTSIKSVKYKDNTNKIVTFNTTPKMSTYLLAFVIADLEYLEKNVRVNNNILVRVYGIPGTSSKLSYALDVATKGLEWYIKWFNINYPLPKLDLVAIPDFDAGAMENWGLITFREKYLLCDETTSLREKKKLAMVINHELAHQWFGNLVTIEDWTYLWLNESMATYFGYWVTDESFPELKMFDEFMKSEYQRALELDSLENSHPIEVPIKKLSEIYQIFNEISYAKGACLIRFLVDYLGKYKFRIGMQHYIENNKYANTTSKDLWDSFNDPKLSNLMSYWTRQTGYPIVNVDHSGNKIILSQQRYNRIYQDGDKNSQLWKIPIKIYYDSKNIEEKFIILEDKELYITDEKYVKSKNLILNPNNIGFFRVKYKNNPNINDIYDIKLVVQILRENFDLSLSGYQDFSKSFELIDKLNLDDIKDHSFWLTFNDFIYKINDLIASFDNGSNKKINDFKTQIPKKYESLKNIFNSWKWDNEPIDIDSHELGKFSALALSDIDDKEVIDQALEKFKSGYSEWINFKNIIIPIVGKNATNELYDELLSSYDKYDNPQLNQCILMGLAHVRNEDLAKRSIELLLSDKIRVQDLYLLIYHLSENNYTCEKTWNFIKDNWKKFEKIYKPGTSIFNDLIKYVSYGFKTQKLLDDFLDFLNEDSKFKGNEMVYNQTIEKIKVKIVQANRLFNEMFN